MGFVKENGRTIPVADKVFALSGRAKAAIADGADEIDIVRSDEEDDAKDLEYKEWWDKQSEETRQAVSDFVRMIIRRNREDTKHMSEFGRSFMLWMQKNAHIKL